MWLINEWKSRFHAFEIDTVKGVDRFKDECSDCSVRALANATGIRYIESHIAHEKNGGKFAEGTYVEDCVKTYSEYGFEVFVHNKFSTITGTRLLKRFWGQNELLIFVNNNPTGVFIVTVQKSQKNKDAHAIAVVNGKIIDDGGWLPSNYKISMIAKRVDKF